MFDVLCVSSYFLVVVLFFLFNPFVPYVCYMKKDKLGIS